MAVPFTQPVVCPVLIGRTPHLDALHQFIDAAHGGHGQTILIAGEAGVGKSRLVVEAKAYAAARGLPLLEGACFPEDSACPYAPLIDLLRARLADHAPEVVAALIGPFVRELSSLLPDLMPLPTDHSVNSRQALPPLDPEQQKRRLFEALLSCLTGPTIGEPMLLVVEDLHWSDEGTLDFLLYLRRRAANQPLLLLGTYRSDEVGPRLRYWLAQLDRERLTEELSLAPLMRDEVAAMLRAIFALQRPARAEFLDAIYSLTEGNPFYVEEILKSLVAVGDIFYVDGAWDRKPLAALRIPRSLHDAVQRRVAQLSEDARRVLTLAAVVGRRFDFSVLERLAHVDEGDLLQLIKELIAAQLVVEESAEQFAFRHALTRQAIYADLLARERIALHRTIAEMIEQIYAGTLDSHIADLAYHFSAAGIWKCALDYGRRAGGRALALGAPHAAVEQFTRAMDAAGNLATTPDPALYLDRGSAFETIGDFDRARGDYEQALRLARDTSDGLAEWQCLIHLGQLWAGRDYEQAGAWFRSTLERAETLNDSTLHAHSLNRLGNWLLNIGQSAEGMQAHHEALALFQSQQDIRGMAETLDLLGMANGIYGDEIACAMYYGQAIDLFRVLDDYQGLSSSLAARSLDAGPGLSETVCSALATRESCERDAAEALQLARQIDWLAGQAFAEWCAGVTLAAFGDFGAGLAHARTALRIATEIEHQQWAAGAQSVLGQIYVLVRAPDLAIQHLEAGLPLAHTLKSSWWIGNITAYLALAYVLKHDLTRAESALAKALPLGTFWAQPPRNLPERRMAWIWGELALAQGAPDQALRIVERLLATGPGTTCGQPIPVLLRLQGEALLALDRPKEALLALVEARRGAEERSERTLLWPILRVLGQAHQQLGQRKEAQRAFAAARDVIEFLAATIGESELREQFLRMALESLPQARPPTPRRLTAGRFGGLTARERQVLRQITLGKSNQDIADALVVSKRTVESHVGSIMTKLGVTTRAQIAMWALKVGVLDDTE